MNITHLDLTNFRGISRLELEFQPGVNVIAGKNGVGKSGILESLAFLLSQIVYETGRNRERRSFASDDVRVGSDFLQADLTCEFEDVPFRASISRNREQIAVDRQDRVTREEARRGTRNTYSFEDEARNKVILHDETQFVLLPDAPLPDWDTFKKVNRDIPFLAVYYATNRAYLRQLAATSGRAKLNPYAGALSGKLIDLNEFAAWVDFLNSPHAVSAHIGEIQGHLEEALQRFLPGFSQLRVTSIENIKAGKISYRARLSIEKEGQKLELQQLSDGERGILAIVLDLARRLSLAYPKHEDPLSAGAAVVLIDEIDLHLHPIWQREVLARLEGTFPRCQFIMTTHSPQVIGQTPVENLLYLEQSGGQVRKKDIGEAFGRDTNWVLSEIMGADERDSGTKEKIGHIFDLIENAEFEDAQDVIDGLRQTIASEPELDRAETRMDMLEPDDE